MRSSKQSKSPAILACNHYNHKRRTHNRIILSTLANYSFHESYPLTLILSKGKAKERINAIKLKTHVRTTFDTKWRRYLYQIAHT